MTVLFAMHATVELPSHNLVDAVINGVVDTVNGGTFYPAVWAKNNRSHKVELADSQIKRIKTAVVSSHVLEYVEGGVTTGYLVGELSSMRIPAGAGFPEFVTVKSSKTGRLVNFKIVPNQKDEAAEDGYCSYEPTDDLPEDIGVDSLVIYND